MERQKDTENIRNNTNKKIASGKCIICHMGPVKNKGF